MRIFRYISFGLTFVALLLISLDTLADNYYIDSSTGIDTNSGTIEHPWKSITKANKLLKAGDTVYIRSGIYTETISPSNSGTLGQYITYQRYPLDDEWSVVISPKSCGAVLSADKHIKIDGLYFKNCRSHWINMVNADYNIIQKCKFYNANRYSGISLKHDSGDGCDYNKILNNIFENAPAKSNTRRYSEELLLEVERWWDDDCENQYLNGLPYNYDCNIGTAPSDAISLKDGHHNVIEGNIMGRFAHDGIALTANTPYTVIRNNKVSNEMHSGGGSGSRLLLEGNILLGGGTAKNYNPDKREREKINGGGFNCFGPKEAPAIIRNNIFSDNDFGIYIGSKCSANAGDQKIYHNTLYNNWMQIVMFGNNCARGYTGNEFKNNIIYDDHNINVHNIVGIKEPHTYQILRNTTDRPGYVHNRFVNNMWTDGADTFYFKNTSTYNKCLQSGGAGSSDCSNGYLETTYPTEWDTSNFYGNPTFVNPASGNFNLQNGSTGIDAATYLTLVNDSEGGSGTDMVVDDSTYFYDGWNIPGEKGDTIYVNNSSSADFIAVISSINYGTHTITLTESKTWDDNASVYHCPSGVCFSGSAPDIGAFECVHNINNSLPTPTEFYLVPVTSDGWGRVLTSATNFTIPVQ